MSLTPVLVLQGLLSLPLFSLVIATLVTVAIAIIRRGQPRQSAVPTRHRAELRAVGAAALALVAVFAAENIVGGYLLLLPNVVEWWRYPTALVAAAVGIAVVGILIASRGSAAPELPVAPTSHRSWTSFGPRVGIVFAAVGLGAIVATSVAAGLASSADSDGRFIYLEVSAPNASIPPLRPWFYGWSYGVPVIIAALVLAVLIWAVLSRNASRPYLRPDLVVAEQDARRRVAAGVVSIATASTLLALGGVFRFIARAGTISQVTTGEKETFDLVWKYAALAAAGWVAPLLEVVAFTTLLLVARGNLRRPLASQAEALTETASR